jgi:hypothetical protein
VTVEESELDVDSLTLPELVAAAEQVRRRVIEHLQYDMLTKVRSLAEQRQDDTSPLFESHDYSCQLLSRWNLCCTEIQDRIDRILKES